MKADTVARMSPEAQRIAIAEACGWNTEGWSEQSYYKRETGTRHFPVDYLEDLNAMHEAEKTLTDEQRHAYEVELRYRVSYGRWPWHATAAQRAEAFLRTLGKWVD